MPIIEVALAEWPDVGGPVVLGRSTDPRIVRAVQEHMAAQRRVELARLEPAVRALESSESDEA